MTNTTTMTTQNVHEGRNLKRIREMLGVKQEALATDLGEEWNQQKISLLEQKEIIDPAILTLVAKKLGVTPEAIKSFNEDSTIYNIQNNYDNRNVSPYQYNGPTTYHECTFNPLDKIVALYDEKMALYERMLKDKEEMIQQLLKK
jgi:transcriptional regulator with XRE-family HTH domain